MRNRTFFTRVFFLAAAALMLAAGALAPRGALWAQDEIAGDDGGDEAAVDRCPGQTQPVCRTKTSGGTTDYYYFP